MKDNHRFVVLSEVANDSFIVKDSIVNTQLDVRCHLAVLSVELLHVDCFEFCDGQGLIMISTAGRLGPALLTYTGALMREDVGLVLKVVDARDSIGDDHDMVTAVID